MRGWATISVGGVCVSDAIRKDVGGQSCTTTRLAVNRYAKRGDAWEQRTTFINVVAWGPLADTLAEQAKKGSRWCIEGRLEMRDHEGRDGRVARYYEVVATRAYPLDSGTRSSEPPTESASEPPTESASESLPF